MWNAIFDDIKIDDTVKIKKDQAESGVNKQQGSEQQTIWCLTIAALPYQQKYSHY